MAKTASVTLEEPVKINGEEIATFTLTRPTAGQMRGIRVAELLTMDPAAHIKLVPRIAKPILTEADVAGMSANDITAVMTAVLPFFATKAQLKEVEAEASPTS